MSKLLLFARAREAAGGVHEIDVEATNAGEALKIAAERFGPAFDTVLQMCSFLVDGDSIHRDRLWDTVVTRNTEIAVLPPVSGGAPKKGAHMVDVGDKEETQREATAICTLVVEKKTRDALLSGGVPKGDATEASRLAGIMAAKRVPELIPLCHPLRITSADVETKPTDEGIEVRATVRGRDRTGFEMEALTACAIAALTLYDMGKSEDARMRVEGLRLIAKSGGKSGSVTFE